MAVKGKRKQKLLKARAQARAAYIERIKAAKQNGQQAPSRYRLRVQKRLRGEPMAARPVPPWHSLKRIGVPSFLPGPNEGHSWVTK